MSLFRNRFEAFVVASVALHVSVALGVGLRADESTTGIVASPETQEASTAGEESSETHAIDSLDEDTPAPIDVPNDSPREPERDDSKDPLAPSLPRAVVKRARASSKINRAASAESAENEPVVGAVGERAASDLALTFTRFLPQITSADAAWSHAPFGALPEATVVLGLSDDGKMSLVSVTGGGDLMSRAVGRTVILFQQRSFTAHGHRVTAHIRARISRDAVHDDVHGDVFAIGARYEDHAGHAFFSLSVGRRIDFELRVTEK